MAEASGAEGDRTDRGHLHHERSKRTIRSREKGAKAKNIVVFIVCKSRISTHGIRPGDAQKASAESFPSSLHKQEYGFFYFNVVTVCHHTDSGS